MSLRRPSDTVASMRATARRNRFHGRGIVSGTYDDAGAMPSDAAPAGSLQTPAAARAVGAASWDDDRATLGSAVASLQFADTSGSLLTNLESAVRTE